MQQLTTILTGESDNLGMFGRWTWSRARGSIPGTLSPTFSMRNGGFILVDCSSRLCSCFGRGRRKSTSSFFDLQNDPAIRARLSSSSPHASGCSALESTLPGPRLSLRACGPRPHIEFIAFFRRRVKSNMKTQLESIL